MAIAKLRIGDQVQVISGGDKGKIGEVLFIADRKIKVSGVRMAKKHVKPNPQKDEKGGIKEQEAWLDHSNVVLYDIASQKPYSVGIKEVDDRRVRYDKHTGVVIESGGTE